MRKLFAILIALGVLLIVAGAVFVFYIYPQKIRPEHEFRDAAALFERGDFVPAALQFEAMKDDPEAQRLSKEAWQLAGDKSFEEGDLAQARTYYLKGGASSEVLAKLDSAYYQLGVTAYAENQRVEAENCFSCISSGSSYLQLLDPVRISCAERFLSVGDFDSAQKVFHLCGDASHEEISRLWLECGKTMLDSFDIDNASFCFAKAMAYSSRQDELSASLDELWNSAGMLARQNGDTALSAKCFARTSNGGALDDAARIDAYDLALQAIAEGRYIEALKAFSAASGYSDADSRAAALRQSLKDHLYAGGAGYYALLEPDGTVALGGDWGGYQAPMWVNISKLALGGNRFMLGLTEAGTVQFHGNASFGNADVSGWHNIIDIACGDTHSAALRTDGTIAACGADVSGEVSGVSEWTGVVDIAAGSANTFGLRADGTVVACGDNSFGQCDTAQLMNITSIAGGGKHLVCLRSDGTVAACGDNSFGQCDTSLWSGVVAVYAGTNHTVALRADGTLAACGDNTYGQCEVSGITDVIGVACGDGFTLILKADGELVKLGA